MLNLYGIYYDLWETIIIFIDNFDSHLETCNCKIVPLKIWTNTRTETNKQNLNLFTTIINTLLNTKKHSNAFICIVIDIK